jgi:hypothetical protein
VLGTEFSASRVIRRATPPAAVDCRRGQDMGAVSRRDGEIVVDLNRPEELLTTDPVGLLGDDGDRVRTVTGVDQLLAELLGRSRVARTKRVVLTLPAAVLSEDSARRLTAAVARWSERRLEQLDREARVLWRQGLRSLRVGTLLFLVGLVFSSDFLEPDIPDVLQQVLGNGVFLVIAWVGLWYPLDLLFFARLPLRREQRVLRALTQMPIDVRARD